jgi:hypothetical protein
VAPVVGAEKANFMGGGAGDGGDADSRAGNGGHGNLPFPNGADGGDIRAQGAVGGTAFIKDLQNTAVGLGGTGGMATWTNGNGGNGNNRCPVTCPGGNGGMGGVATGGDGAGGNGVPPGPRGGMVLNTVARGGNAGSGFMPGVRGVKGNNAITPPAAGAGSFVDGANAVICFPAGLITMSLVSVVDPAGHNPFLKFCTAPSMSFAGGGTTMSVSFAGSPDGIGPFGASGIVTPAPMTLMGTAMFSGTVPVTVTILGVSATGEVTFTVQIGGPTAPMGHPLQVPIIYTKKFQLPQACPMGAAPSPQPDNNAEVSALRWLSSTAARWSDAMFAGVREGARLMR